MDQWQTDSLFKMEIRFLQWTKHLIFHCNLQWKFWGSLRWGTDKQEWSGLIYLWSHDCKVFCSLIERAWAPPDQLNVSLSITFCGATVLLDKHPPAGFSCGSLKHYCPLLSIPAFCQGSLLHSWNTFVACPFVATIHTSTCKFKPLMKVNSCHDFCLGFFPPPPRQKTPQGFSSCELLGLKCLHMVPSAVVVIPGAPRNVWDHCSKDLLDNPDPSWSSRVIPGWRGYNPSDIENRNRLSPQQVNSDVCTAL